MCRIRRKLGGLICASLLLLLFSPAIVASETEWTFGGHLKYQATFMHYPDNSIFRDLVGSGSLDNSLETRLKLSGRRDNWDFKADYQLSGFIPTPSNWPMNCRAPRCLSTASSAMTGAGGTSPTHLAMTKRRLSSTAWTG